MTKYFFVILNLCLLLVIKAQPWFKRVDSVVTSINSNNLTFPWVGGLNSCQFSQIDLNQDGIKDLFVFDRTGFRISTFINKGTANTVDYVFAPQYRDQFPSLVNWVILADYNCDGKEDIFTSTAPSGGSITIYRNDSDVNGLKFTRVTYPYLKSNYHPNVVNLYVTSVDVPAITDLDGDGDIDIVTMTSLGTFFEYHQNMSKETYGVCDSLNTFQLSSGCWGNFSENFADNTVNLNQSCKLKSYVPDSINMRHSGSCEVCYDINGDGDKEILIGGISFDNMTLVVNGGNAASANMTSQDANYPSTSTPINLASFPCGFYIDVDNDGLNDLIVSPNAANASENFTSVLLYKNIASPGSFTPSFQKNNFLQDQMIDVGEGAFPVFFDADGDGKKDLLIGNYKYYTASGLQSKIAFFKNTGTLSNPSFDLVTRDYQNLSSLNIISMMPAFGDLDGDGDADMMIGDDTGELYYFTNNPSSGVSNFTLTQANYEDSAAKIIDVGNYAAPQLVDVDRDGKLDLIIGASNGKLAYYHNSGTVNAPQFNKVSSNFGGVNVVRKSTFSITGYSAPFMYDSGGTYKLLLGSESGYLYYYNNIDGNLNGNFTLVDSSYQQVWEGTRTALGGADINNDGLIDVVIGNYAGGVAMYCGQASNPLLVKNVEQKKFDFSLYPNPVEGLLVVSCRLSGSSNIQISIFDMFGREVKQVQSNESLVKIDMSSLPDGMYICKVSLPGENVYAVKKFVVKSQR